jgi:hypothetical protein
MYRATKWKRLPFTSTGYSGYWILAGAWISVLATRRPTLVVNERNFMRFFLYAFDVGTRSWPSFSELICSRANTIFTTVNNFRLEIHVDSFYKFSSYSDWLQVALRRGSVFESRWGQNFLFSTSSRQALRPMHSPGSLCNRPRWPIEVWVVEASWKLVQAFKSYYGAGEGHRHTASNVISQPYLYSNVIS